MKSSNVAILAGGFGTRLKSRMGNMPKPMALILGKPILEHQILLCKKYGFIDISFLVHYEFEIIKEYFKDGSEWGVNINYVVEKDPRGTAGALYDALEYMNEQFLVLYGDTYLDVDLHDIFNFHKKHNADATIMVHPNDHPNDSDLVDVDENLSVIKIHPYPHPDGIYLNNLVNAALYVLNNSVLKQVIPEFGKHDLAKHTFNKLIEKEKKILAYKSQEYIKDMGTPERLDRVERDIINGIAESLSKRHPRKTVFIDRDGTINKEVNHLNNIDEFVLIPNVGDAIRKLNRSGRLTVCITNQPVLARGELSFEGLKNIHNKLDHELGLHGAYLDNIYVCPHHNTRGFAGEIIDLKIDCDCRKPKTGLFDKAIKEMYIDRRKSWFIGDTTSDIKAGFDAGLRTILVRTGYAGGDLKYTIQPEFIFPDLNCAVDFILNGYNELVKKIIPFLHYLIGKRLVLIGGPARTGKSTTAQVLSDMLSQAGVNSHIISIDGWLKPKELKNEGVGVINRYDISRFSSLLKYILNNNKRVEIDIPIYDRLNQTISQNYQISVGPNDLLIVEGVSVLLSDEILKLTDCRIFVDIDEAIRNERLIADYTWRTNDLDAVKIKLKSRLIDEVAEIRNSAKFAKYII